MINSGEESLVFQQPARPQLYGAGAVPLHPRLCWRFARSLSRSFTPSNNRPRWKSTRSSSGQRRRISNLERQRMHRDDKHAWPNCDSGSNGNYRKTNAVSPIHGFLLRWWDSNPRTFYEERILRKLVAPLASAIQSNHRGKA